MFSESRVVGCECERIYDVVADVERYPEFVPGWHEVRVLRRDDASLLVEQRLGLGAINTWVRSQALLQRPQSIVVQPVDERASGLHLEWRFERCVTGGCHVTLHIYGQSSSRMLALVLDEVADRAGHHFVELFAARSAALHGAPCNPDSQT